MNGKIFSAVCVAVFGTMVAQAIPTSGESMGEYYLGHATDLNSWHAGGYFRAHQRVLEKDGRKLDLDHNHGALFVGYDVTKWLAVYGLCGYSQMEEKGWGGKEDSSIEWGVGMWLNLLDHSAYDFNELLDRYRIQAAAQYSIMSNDLDTFGELSAYLAFGIVNEVQGSKEFWLDAYSVYFGPCVNVLTSDDYEQDGDDAFGLVFGLDVQISERISIGGSYEMYDDDDCAGATLSVRF